MHARGEDAKLIVMVDGAEQLVFRSLENVDINWGLLTDEYNYVGAAHPETDETNGPCTITFRINPDSPDYDKFVDLRRKRALPQETRSEVTFDITSSVNFGDAGRARWRFPDVKISDGNTSIGGRTARVGGGLTAHCDNPSKMA
jgi:hypothetical protein